jgi:hypothetical protein
MDLVRHLITITRKNLTKKSKTKKHPNNEIKKIKSYIQFNSIK